MVMYILHMRRKKKMSKFKVGDIVTTDCNERKYGVTSNKGTYKVLRIYDDIHMTISVIDHLEKTWIGSTYVVYTNDFYLFEGKLKTEIERKIAHLSKLYEERYAK